MKSIIDIKKIKQSNDGMIRQEYTWLDTKYVILPNVVGMSVKEAVKELKKFKVEYSGSGDIITYQSPSAGENVYEGETIRLLLTE